MSSQLTKNQHFVPQFLLRNFSIEENGEYRCCVYDIQRELVRERQNIKNVFSRNFMYDKNNVAEKYLDKNVENLVVEEIKNILNNPYNTMNSPSESLLRFITVQLRRTQQAYEQTLGFINEGVKSIFEEIARLNELDVDSARQIIIKPSDPSILKAYQSLRASLTWPLIKDLHHHILINKSCTEFIISDHPVFQYNWYLRKENNMIVSSIGAIGIQLFIPFSPNICYALYDPSIYKYGAAKKSFTEIYKKEDVDILNSFQVLNAESNIVFRQSSMGSQINKHSEKWGTKNTYISEVKYQQAIDIGNGQMKSTHVTWMNQIRIPFMPAFVKLRKKSRKNMVVAMYRNPLLMTALDEYIAQISGQKKS